MIRQQKSLGRPYSQLDGIAVGEIAYPPGFEQPRHYHDWSSVTLVVAGGLEERVGSTVAVAAPLSVVVKPAGTEHSDRVGPDGAHTLQIAFAAERVTGDESWLGAWRWLHAGSSARHVLALLRLLRGRSDQSVLEAAVFDVLAGLEPDRRRNRGGLPPRWLSAVAEEIDERFAERLRVRDLAREAGVHPVSLARAFRRCFGMTVSDRIRARRLQAAADLLGRRDRSLSGIAFSAGFADQSHLCRAFKSATGLTPGRFRNLVVT